MEHDEDQRKQIGEMLVEKGVISQKQLDDVLEERKSTGEKLGQILVRKKLSTAKDIEAVINASGRRKFDISSHILDPDVMSLVPESVIMKYNILLVAKNNKTLTVAMVNPKDIITVEEIARITGYEIDPILADAKDIAVVHKQVYLTDPKIKGIIENASVLSEKASSNESEKNTIELVEHLTKEAINAGASDMHIESEKKVTGVRFRVDGILQHKYFLPKNLEAGIFSRFKVMGNLDISEKRSAQDGRAIVKVGKKDIDMRISTCPTIHGENLVLRILDKDDVIVDVNNIGMLPPERDAFVRVLKKTYGIILVTGPTGSGKTTTLYAALKKINRESINIMTAEDPVEFDFPRIVQVQVDKKKTTFPKVLRTFLRQDPDVIMVGEIRDLETAEIAIQASLTGHLVLSTVHSNETTSTFARLIDMGIKPFLVSDAVIGVVAQRLIRKNCPQCNTERDFSDKLKKTLGEDEGVIFKDKFMQGKGCQHCNGIGYKGRTGVYEFLEVTQDVQALIASKASAEEIKRVALKNGMRTLKEIALKKMTAGIVSPEEVLRVI